MAEFEVRARIQLALCIEVEAEDVEAAEKEAMGWFENDANFQIDTFNNVSVTDIDIDDVNEV